MARVADYADGIKQIFVFAKNQPFSGGFIVGSIFSAVLSYLLAKTVGFKAYRSVASEWEKLCRVKDKEIKELRKQQSEKDVRITKCHEKIEQLEAKSGQTPA